MSLRTSRVGFEGFGLQAEPRPAECRRIPRSMPKFQMPPLVYLWFWTPNHGKSPVAILRITSTYKRVRLCQLIVNSRA